MQMKTKSGAVQFEHDDQYRGDVVISRDGVSVTVPMAALRNLVAESVRQHAQARIAAAKPEVLLRGLV